MLAGNLIKVTLARIGVPAGTIALITSVTRSNFDDAFNIYEVQFIGPQCRIRQARMLEQDMLLYIPNSVAVLVSKKHLKKLHNYTIMYQL